MLAESESIQGLLLAGVAQAESSLPGKDTCKDLSEREFGTVTSPISNAAPVYKVHGNGPKWTPDSVKTNEGN